MQIASTDGKTWVETPVPEDYVTDEMKKVFLAPNVAWPKRGRPFQKSGHWYFRLSAELSYLVKIALTQEPSAYSPDLLLGLIELELKSGGTTSAQEAISDIVAIEPRSEAVLQLTHEEADELASTGSLVEAMPPMTQRASIRTQVRQRRIIDEALHVAQVASLLGVSESRVRQRASSRTLFAVKLGNALRFPAFQFPDGAELPGWEAVAPRFPDDAHPLAVERFMLTPHPELEVAGNLATPTDWLRTGGPAIKVAELVGDAYTIA